MSRLKTYVVGRICQLKPVVAHIGEVSTRETIRPGSTDRTTGRCAVSVIHPLVCAAKRDELIAHYAAMP